MDIVNKINKIQTPYHVVLNLKYESKTIQARVVYFVLLRLGYLFQCEEKVELGMIFICFYLRFF